FFAQRHGAYLGGFVAEPGIANARDVATDALYRGRRPGLLFDRLLVVAARERMFLEITIRAGSAVAAVERERLVGPIPRQSKVAPLFDGLAAAFQRAGKNPVHL